MGKFKKKYVGTKHFGPTIDITDPCYNKDVWCRINGLEIKEGDYNCIAWIDEENKRVAIAGIYLKNTRLPDAIQMKCIGDIGVDAGLAGFFMNKPDYTDNQWSEFCDRTFKPDGRGNRKDAWIFDEGFFTSSGWGDGCYDVCVAENKKGEVYAVEILFYGQYKDEDEYEDEE